MKTLKELKAEAKNALHKKLNEIKNQDVQPRERARLASCAIVEYVNYINKLNFEEAMKKKKYEKSKI